MELLIGSHVREHGTRVGRLAGFELDPATRSVSQIIFSASGTLGPEALMRPLMAVSHVHNGGEIELRTDIDEHTAHAPGEVVLLGPATRLRTAGHDVGHLTGIDVNPADQHIVSMLGRAHWWTRPVAVDAAAVDLSTLVRS
jgi:sporulation protein YlmC with PRC-barrel domain